MSDRLAPVLSQFELHCRVLQTQGPCSAPAAGHLHLLRGGGLRWRRGSDDWQRVERPSLLLFAAGEQEQIEVDAGSELVCARVAFDAQFGNPLLRGLPSPWVLPLDVHPELEQLLALFFDEAAAGRCGRAAMLDRYAELIVIQLLRLGLQQGLLQVGTLAGLAEPRLAKALTAIHEAPQQAWTLARMAATAGMSRARFAAQFTERVGSAPGEYLGGLRIGIAQRLIRRGLPLKAVAAEVGYGSANALSRAFQQRLGLSPSDWRQRQAPLSSP